MECYKLSGYQISVPDFVMEPQIVGVLQTFFRCGGDPETVVNLLSENYYSLGQVKNPFV